MGRDERVEAKAGWPRFRGDWEERAPMIVRREGAVTRERRLAFTAEFQAGMSVRETGQS